MSLAAIHPRQFLPQDKLKCHVRTFRFYITFRDNLCWAPVNRTFAIVTDFHFFLIIQVLNGTQLYVPKEKILSRFLQFKPTENSGCLSLKMFGYLNEGTAGILIQLNFSYLRKETGTRQSSILFFLLCC